MMVLHLETVYFMLMQAVDTEVDVQEVRGNALTVCFTVATHVGLTRE